MSDTTDVQEYIKRENARRGRGENDGDDGEEDGPGSGGLYGMTEWKNPNANDRFGGYSRGSI